MPLQPPTEHRRAHQKRSAVALVRWTSATALTSRSPGYENGVPESTIALAKGGSEDLELEGASPYSKLDRPESTSRFTKSRLPVQTPEQPTREAASAAWRLALACDRKVRRAPFAVSGHPGHHVLLQRVEQHLLMPADKTVPLLMERSLEHLTLPRKQSGRPLMRVAAGMRLRYVLHHPEQEVVARSRDGSQ